MLESSTLRLEEAVLKKISKKALQKHLDKSTYMRQLLMKGLQEEELDNGIKDYCLGKITLEELSERTGKSVWAIMEILKQRNVQSPLKLKDIKTAAKVLS